MRNRSQEFVIGLSRLVLIVFVLSVSLITFAQQASAQWRDAATGQPVASGPIIVTNTPTVTGQNIVNRGVLPEAGDPNRAFDPETGRNFARDANGIWRDTATGKPVASGPIIVTNTPTVTGQNIVNRGVLPEAGDPNRAFDPETGRNFVRSTGPTTPIPTAKKVIEKKKEACDIEFGYDYMRAPDESAKSLNGFGGSLFCNVKSWMAIGGDFAASFGSTTDTIGTTPVDTSLHRQTYLGVRNSTSIRTTK